MTKRTFHIYRYDPDADAKPYMQTIEVELDGSERIIASFTAAIFFRSSALFKTVWHPLRTAKTNKHNAKTDFFITKIRFFIIFTSISEIKIRLTIAAVNL